MKKIILIIAIFTSSLIANELKTVYSYRNALYKAKKEHKIVMIMMSYRGCPVCDYMKDIVFERENVLDYLNKNFYVVIKDLEKDRYPQRFSAIDSPTFFFIDPKTKKETIPKKVGGFKPENFLTILHEANNDIEKIIVSTEQNSTVSSEVNSTITPCAKAKPCHKESKVTIN